MKVYLLLAVKQFNEAKFVRKKIFNDICVAMTTKTTDIHKLQRYILSHLCSTNVT